ncbi:MAG: hypothetical protein ACLR4Z_10385 [Butyricicoccaceae bacterium]
MIKHLENLTGINAQNIPLDDPETMSLFHSCKALRYKGENPDTDPILGDLGCVAVPEFGTKFVRGMVRETHPSTFAELVSISGLSHGTDVWLGNAAELVRKGIPLSGCICCRDDIMNYLILQGVKPKPVVQDDGVRPKGQGSDRGDGDRHERAARSGMVHRLLQENQIYVPEGARGGLRHDGVPHCLVQGT